eukprot:SAG11_NODE_6689_length_1266_cov_0.807198_3_plen_61_part_01
MAMPTPTITVSSPAIAAVTMPDELPDELSDEMPDGLSPRWHSCALMRSSTLSNHVGTPRNA